MRIPSFRVERYRGVVLAKCDEVPRLMIVAGPNGCGKSTLLDALRRQPGEGPILYVGPHRVSRRQHVFFRHLLASSISLRNLLTLPNTPGFEGIQLMGGSRDPWGFDDTTNYLKHALCQIELERQQAIAHRFDREQEIVKGALPDVWEPMSKLTSNLLPHLRFFGIDSSNRDNVRCNWMVHGKEAIIDLDELSSGEKSIVQMFYPLIEPRIKALLGEIRGQTETEPRTEICVLIDEPELHLHPNLQMKVLDYLRVLSSDEKTQLIVATQSSTIVESANFEELFLLRPSELVDSGENQLIQVATEEERLRTLRDLFGSTTNLTSLQPIVVVEGGDEKTSAHAVSDRKLYRALHTGFDRVTLIPGGGKGECLRLQQLLSGTLARFTGRLRVLALLDRDLSNDAQQEGVWLLPVSMLENLLLDPDAIWEAIQSVIERTPFKSVDDVENAIDTILDQAEAPEQERRVLRRLGAKTFRPTTPLQEVSRQAEDFAAQIVHEFSNSRITTCSSEMADIIQQLKSTRQRREFFDGKNVLGKFCAQYLHSSGLAKSVFLFEAARHARRRKKVQEFFDRFFENISHDQT